VAVAQNKAEWSISQNFYFKQVKKSNYQKFTIINQIYQNSSNLIRLLLENTFPKVLFLRKIFKKYRRGKNKDRVNVPIQ
jgi:hypothetical protein